MLPDVAQKVDQSLRAEPFRIVEQDGGGGPGAELEKARHLIALVLQVLTDLFFRSEEHTSELQSHHDLVCRLLLEKKKKKNKKPTHEKKTNRQSDPLHYTQKH